MLIQSDKKKGKNMNIYIENQYKKNIDIDYENLINMVVSYYIVIHLSTCTIIHIFWFVFVHFVIQ